MDHREAVGGDEALVGGWEFRYSRRVGQGTVEAPTLDELSNVFLCNVEEQWRAREADLFGGGEVRWSPVVQQNCWASNFWIMRESRTGLERVMVEFTEYVFWKSEGVQTRITCRS